MKRHSWLKPKRDRPRRNEGRIQHGRMKPKVGAPPTAEEERFHKWVRSLRCIISGKPGPSTLHHVTSTIHGGRLTRDHKRVVPLAPEYHLIQHGPRTSVEALSHRGIHATLGIDLLAEAEKLWERWQKKEGELGL